MLSDLWSYLLQAAGAVWGFIENVAGPLSGLSTVAIAVLTFYLWKENKRLRRAGSDPLVVAHFETHPDGTGGVNLALSNIGTGPAFDVSFSLHADPQDFEDHRVYQDLTTDRPAFTLIPSGDKISFLFGIGFRLFKKEGQDSPDPLKPFNVTVKWRSAGRGKIRSAEYTLDVTQFTGLPGMMNKPYALRTAESLENINKTMGTMTNRVQTIANLIDSTSFQQACRQHVKGNPTSLDPKEE